MRRYVVLLAQAPDGWDATSEAERQEYAAAHLAFEEYVDSHGRRICATALAGADTATTIRHVDGAVTVSDGPFADSAEQLGGYYDVELPDLDSAIEAGSLLPPSYAVEIRPAVTVEGLGPA